jgi:hypothetical protein
MSPIRRLALIVLAALAGPAVGSLPVRAQTPVSTRYAFQDTTLLRDTLGLHFDRLFETADSLRMLPDTLRAQVIRYRLPIHRLVAMADSMGVPVDSVGVAIDREAFNPLAARMGAAPSTGFRYTSGYTIFKNSSTWTNGGDYVMTRGAMSLHNNTTINMQRSILSGSGGVSLTQDRLSTTDANWRTGPGFSLGGRAVLSGYDRTDPTSVGSNEAERRSEFQFSSRARRQFGREFNSELNTLAGLLNLKNFSQIKRGLSGDVNGRTRWLHGNWFSHDLNYGLNGNVSRTRRPTSVTTVGTSDYSGTLRGALQLYQAAPVGLNLNYTARKTRVETPGDSDLVNRLLTSAAGTDATLRFRVDNNRYLNLTGGATWNNTLQGARDDQTFRGESRWTAGPWALDTSISDQITNSNFFVNGTAGGYLVKDNSRQANGTLSRPFGQKIVGKVTGNITLTQTRSAASISTASPPTPHDNYLQSYRFDTQYNQSEKFNTGVALEVSLARSINLPAVSTSNNTDTRTYRAEWHWSFLLLRGLTANQTNTVQSAYEFYPFAADRNNLSLDYNSVTNLSAVLTPRLTVQLSHNARQQPRGDWRVLTDGTGVLLPSDENLNYTLNSLITWSPSPDFSFSINPQYLAADRTGTSNGVAAPTRSSRGLHLNGSVNLKIALGRKGELSGQIGRNFSADRTTTYQNGAPLLSPVSNQDYWNGALNLSWQL